MKHSIIIGLAITMITTACNHNHEDSRISNNTTIIQNNNNQPEQHHAKNSLDWAGHYEGIIPCADCPGIKITITLYLNQTFKRAMEYLERDSKYQDSGKIFWNEDGNQITLITPTDSTIFKVIENKLIQLDAQGNPITGDIAKHFILNKK